MDIYTARREALLELINDEFAGQRSRFCDRVAISESRLAQLLSPTYRDGTAFTEKTARKLEDACGLPHYWLDRNMADGGNPMRGLPPGTFRRVNVLPDEDSAFVMVPKVKLLLSAGISGFQTEPDDDQADGSYVALPSEWVRKNGYHVTSLQAINVRGNSMDPVIAPGDLVVVNTADREPADGAVFAFNYEGEAVVKRMERDAGEWWLRSDNPDQNRYPRKVCRNEACLIVGRVVFKQSTMF
jgi:hypothetical protein